MKLSTIISATMYTDMTPVWAEVRSCLRAMAREGSLVYTDWDWDDPVVRGTKKYKEKILNMRPLSEGSMRTNEQLVREEWIAPEGGIDLPLYGNWNWIHCSAERDWWIQVEDITGLSDQSKRAIEIAREVHRALDHPGGTGRLWGDIMSHLQHRVVRAILCARGISF